MFGFLFKKKTKPANAPALPASAPASAPVAAAVPPPAYERAEYERVFAAACVFTTGQGFALDAKVFEVEASRVANAVADLTSLMPGHVLADYCGSVDERISQFGGNCGNLHSFSLLELRKLLPGVPVNLTIGHFEPAKPGEFDFTEETFKSWLKAKPPVLDCHVWLTIGTNLIVDLTLATFINTRRLGSKDLRGTLFGLPGMLKLVGDAHPQQKLPKISYRPVAVGEQALKAIGPSPQ